MDPKKLEDAISSHRERAIAVAANILGPEDAEDAVQDAALRAWRYSDSYDQSHPFWSWYSRIVVNCAFAWLKKNAAHRSHVPLDSCVETRATDPEEGPDQATLHEMSREHSAHALKCAMRTLFRADRDLVQGYYIEGKPIERVAAEAGVGVGAARMRLLRSLKALRPALSEALAK